MEFVQVDMPVATKSALGIKGAHVPAKSALGIKGLLPAKSALGIKGLLRPSQLRRRCLELGGRHRQEEGPHEQTRLLSHAFQSR